MQRDYYGSRHGKNRCDGEGGVLKSRVARAVRNEELIDGVACTVNSAEEFYRTCQKLLEKESIANNGNCCHKRRKIIYVPKERIIRPRPHRMVKTVAGTQKMHSVRGVERGVIKARRLSCFYDFLPKHRTFRELF